MSLATPDPDALFERLLAGAELQKDSQLAHLLGVSPQAISQARRKRKIPQKWLIKVSMQCGKSMDWLLFGEGEDPVAPPHPEKTHKEPNSFPEPELLYVPMVSATLSAGVGSLDTSDDVTDFFAFRADWLCRKGNPDRMVMMKVYGDSMEPQVCHGDTVLIDQSKQNIYPHTMYAVGVNEEIYIKQVETLPGYRMLLRSLNKNYDPIEVDLRGDMADSVRIIGKVIWWCREA